LPKRGAICLAEQAAEGRSSMALMNLRTFAAMVAMYVKKQMAGTPRGAILIRCLTDATMVGAVFGNDNYMADGNTRREVDLVRQELAHHGVTELGFGLTPDGSTWALLASPEKDPYQTAAGKAFHLELFRIFLDDAVQQAWCSASGANADSGTRRTVEHRQPAP
jgi:hypothetical protein